MENQSLTEALSAARLFLDDDALVCINMESDGILFLQKQLERDIPAKGFWLKPIPFTLLELIDIERLLPEEVSNRVMTHRQRKLIAQYCAHYYVLARDAEDDHLAAKYDEFLSALLEKATIITFLL